MPLNWIADYSFGLLKRSEPNDPAPFGEQEKLQAFVDDFLMPIAADGRLDVKYEQTPLLAAFCAYGIDQLLARDRETVESSLRQAIAAAAAKGDSPAYAARLWPAWERITRHTGRISKAEYEKLRNWFRQEAAKPRETYAFDDQPADAAFGNEAISPQAVQLFYRLFREISPSAPVEPAPTPDDSAESPQAVSRRVTTVEFERSFRDDLAGRVKSAVLHAREKEIVAGLEPMLAAGRLPGLAFDDCRADCQDQAVVIPALALPADANLWFLGDLHGDLLTLECAWSYISGLKAARPPVLVLLGDLFDDGGFGYEVLLRVFELMVKSPGQIAVLAGNHDEAFALQNGTFTSSVSPSDFTDWLNLRAADPIKRRVGELAIEYFKSAPRALFLPDGLLAAHGGVPHSGRWPGIKRREDFNSRLCLQDFVWNRAHERAKVRIPSDASRGCEFGSEDFANFCKLATEVLGQPVARMIRGHDHVEERYLFYDKYVANKLLTINGMSRRLPREAFGPYERTACVARWVYGQLPEVHRLVLPPELIREVYPEPRVDDAKE